jgi:hypothetical protein
VPPYWVPEAPLPGPRVPFCPKAGRDCCELAARAGSLLADWVLAAGAELELVEDEATLDAVVGDATGVAGVWCVAGVSCIAGGLLVTRRDAFGFRVRGFLRRCTAGEASARARR